MDPPQVVPDQMEISNGVSGIDPESDAQDALRTLRSYLLAELPAEVATDLDDWPEFDDYIGDLCSRGLENLEREPDLLSAESERMRLQLEEVSCTNYRTLIESFECAGAVREGVGKIRARLDMLIEALPPLATATREFSSVAANAQMQREARLRTLAEYGRVVDILEMPRLMRSFVVAELYDEALELYDMSMKLASLHSDDPTLESVCAEVDAIANQMTVQLVSVLRGALQLPTCLHVIGFLRRMEVFSEPTLRMLFLQCRGDWMRSSLDAVVAPNAQAKLVRLCDDSRAMIFEIITQYRAAFADDDDSLGEEYGGEFGDDGFPARDSGDGALGGGPILFDWTTSVISQYLKRLEAGLADVKDGASLSTVMQQAMYCGQSLGRVGGDFRPVLVPLFESSMLRVFDSYLTAAIRQFEVMIEDHRWAPVGSSALRKNRHLRAEKASSPLASPGTPGGDVPENLDSGGVTFDPPMAVLDSPALAVFLNGILAALNELRSCPILSLSDEVAERIKDVLIGAAECVTATAGPGGAFLKHSDRAHFSALHVSLRDLCVPHVARCVDHCMGRRGLVNTKDILRGISNMFGREASLTVTSSADTTGLIQKAVKTEQLEHEAVKEEPVLVEVDSDNIGQVDKSASTEPVMMSINGAGGETNAAVNSAEAPVVEAPSKLDERVEEHAEGHVEGHAKERESDTTTVV